MFQFSDTHGNAGFTLVELLIVVIILATLAVVVMPSFGSSSEDAKVSTLKADLALIRRALERYQVEHDGRYPGAVLDSDGQTAPANPGACKQAFYAQLTRFTDSAGKASGTRSSSFPLGPYLGQDKLPANPFLSGSIAAELSCELATANLLTAPTADGSTGWKFYVLTGRLVANDDTTLSDGSVTLTF